MTIRIMLVDDHPVVRRGLAQFLSEENDFHLVAECADGASALRVLEEAAPDIMLVDLNMPNMDGLELARRVCEASSTTKTILLTGNVTDEQIIEALGHGVKGVVLKEEAPSVLVDCVRRVHAGEVWVVHESDGRLLEKMLNREKTIHEPLRTLTEREREVVGLVIDGISNKEIAIRLSISEATVKSHLTSIFDKLGVRGRMQLVNFARSDRA